MSVTIKKPEWLRKRISYGNIDETEKLLRSLKLNTVCEGAQCPNIDECFGRKTTTFMILGNICTRGCRFCAVEKGIAYQPDPNEPMHVAEASKILGLRHIVITSVTRDDLPDGGAEHYFKTVGAIKALNPSATIELLIPDLKGNWKALKRILDAKPDILNHNLETVASLYKTVRPQADYGRSLELLRKAKEIDSGIYTKSGIMVGLGEKVEEVNALMDDLRAVCCDIITIGQYLRPSENHLEVFEYVHPNDFEAYRVTAMQKGFRYAASGPFVRSSYNAVLGMDKINNSTI
jgi:lipoate synthase